MKRWLTLVVAIASVLCLSQACWGGDAVSSGQMADADFDALAARVTGDRRDLPRDVAGMIDFVRDPVRLYHDPRLVETVALSLGHSREVGAVPALLESIAYPLYLQPRMVGGKQVAPVQMTIARLGPGDMWGQVGKLSSLPMARSLIGIGEACIPQVLSRLSTTNDRLERVACLQVLLGLRARGEVNQMIRHELAVAQSDQARELLQKAIDKLPDVDAENGDRAYLRELLKALSPHGADGRVDILVSLYERDRRKMPDLSACDVSTLIRIVDHPVLQSQDDGLVYAAAGMLGKTKAREAVPALVESIGFPLKKLPCVFEGTPLPPSLSMEFEFSSHNMSPYSVHPDKMPMVVALMAIGEPCLLEVVSKLSRAEDRVERVACLEVLLSLRTRSLVAELLHRQLALSSNARERELLQMAIDKLPHVSEMWGDTEYLRGLFGSLRTGA